MHVNQTCYLIVLKLSDPAQRADCAWCIIRCRDQARTAGHPAKSLNVLLLEGLLTYVFLSPKEALLRGRFDFANTRRQLQRDMCLWRGAGTMMHWKRRTPHQWCTSSTCHFSRQLQRRLTKRLWVLHAPFNISVSSFSDPLTKCCLSLMLILC